MTIPSELINSPKWVLWRREEVSNGRNSRVTKVPYQPCGYHASATEERTWSDYRTVERARRHYDGIAYVITPDSGLVGIDMDNCIQDGKLSSFAAHVVNRLDSFAEVSQSGQGVHIMVRAQLPGMGRKTEQCEMYCGPRAWCITGDHLSGTRDTIEPRQEEICALHRRLFPSLYIQQERLKSKRYENFYRTNLSDEEVIRRCMTMPKFVRLFRHGDTTEYAQDQSRAELAMINQLSLFTRDPEQIDRIYRQSALSRDKWDRRTAGSTYGHLTIQRALAGNRSLAR